MTLVEEALLLLTIPPMLALIGFLGGIIKGWWPEAFFVLVMGTIVCVVVFMAIALVVIGTRDEPFEFSPGAFVGGLIGGLVLVPSVKLGENFYLGRVRRWP